MRMKKLLSVLLVVAMLASMAVTAFAETTPVSGLGENDIVVAAVADSEITVESNLSNVTLTAGTEDTTADRKVTITNNNVSSEALQGAKLKVTVNDGSQDITSGVSIKVGETPTELVGGEFTLGDVTTDNATEIAIKSMQFDTEGTYTVKFSVVFSDNTTTVAEQTAATVTVGADNSGSEDQATVSAVAVTGFDSAFTAGTAGTGSVTVTGTKVGTAKVTAVVTPSDGVAINSGKDTEAVNMLTTGKVVEFKEGALTQTITLDEIKFATKGSYTVKFVAAVDGETEVTSEKKVNVNDAPIVTGDVSVEAGTFEKQDGTNTYVGTVTLKNTADTPKTDVKVSVTHAEGVTVTGTVGEAATEWAENTAITIPASGQETVTFTVECPDENEQTIKVTATYDTDKTATSGDIKVGGTGTGGDGGNEGGDGGNEGGNNPGTGSGGLWDDDEDSSSGSSSAAAPSANVGSNGAVSAVRVNSDAKKAVSNAKNGTANVNVTNAKTVDSTALNAMAKTAAKADVDLTMTAKTTDRNGNVVATLKFDTAEAAKAVAAAEVKEVKLGVELNTKNTKSVTSLFKKWFKNKNLATVKMAQKGEFGFNVTAAVKVDLKNFNKDTLHFYSYDAATNTYKQINTKYTIDSKGLVHFNTTVGNYIIVTDAPITSK